MKKIYFVRHGEGEHNLNKLYSTPHFNLTEKGKKQAAVLAERLTHLPIDLIVCSSFKRTKQTAEIINKKVNAKIIYTDLAIEIKRPKEITGKSWEDPEVIKIRRMLDENFTNSDWHFSDEENFFDLKSRVEEFLRYLQNFKEVHILVVSHVNFIRMTFLVMLLEEALTPQIYLKAYDFLHLATSGLTLFQRNDSKNHTEFGTEKHTDWKLITWNDQSHLAD